MRKFRHFFRNAYVFDLDPVKTLAHADRVMRVHLEIARDIAALFSHLESVRQLLAGAGA